MQQSVSVLLISYNHEKLIAEAIKSVFIQKEYIKDIELIVLDDGSSDNTPDILRRMQRDSPIRMNVIFNKHEGVAAIARNMLNLIELSSNKYIAFLASDDSYVPNRFKKQIDILEKNLNCQIVYGNGTNIRNGEVAGLVVRPKEVELMKALDPCAIFNFVTSAPPQIYLQAVLAKRSFLENVIPFDDDLIADDWVFNIKVFRYLCNNKLDFGYLDESLFNRNLLDTSTSNNYYHHFNRVAGVAVRYLDVKNKKFYLRFYLGYIKAFLKKKDFNSAWKISKRFFLLILGSRKHNIKLSQLISIKDI